MRIVRLISGLVFIAVLPAPAGAQANSLTTSDSVALLTAIYGTALNNGLRTAHASERPELVCVDGLRGSLLDAVVAALRDSTQRLVRPALACRVEPLRASPRTSRSLVVDTLTGARGILIRATLPQLADNGSFTFSTTYYEHGLSGADWECAGQRRGQVWTIVSCILTRIS
jgi:hypothetical protein